MSGTPALPNRNNPVQRSNSTANIFLGGVRRSWMNASSASASSLPSTAITNPPPSTPTPTTTSSFSPVSAVAPAAATAGSTRQGMRNSSLRVPLVSSQSQQNVSPQPPPVQSQPQPQSLPQSQPQSQPQTQFTSTLMSPGIPDSFQPQIPPQSGPCRISNHPPLPPLATTTITPPATTNASPSVSAQQSPLISAPSPHVSSRVHANLSNTSPQVRAATSTSPSIGTTPRGARASTDATSAYPSPAGQNPRQLNGRAPQPSQPNAPNPGIIDVNRAFFDDSLKDLRTLSAYLEGTGSFHGPVERPRLELLSAACEEHDCLFLMVHQVFCLHSLDPAEFFKLAGFTEKQSRGLNVIKRLLVDNATVSADFLRWCTHFPAPLPLLLQTPLFQEALNQCAQCLARLEFKWDPYMEQVRTRGFPPLISEIVVNFGIKSPGLAQTIFTATCRCLPGYRIDGSLLKVWDQDLHNYKNRCASVQPISKARVQQEDDRVIQLYRLLYVHPATPSTPWPMGERHPSQSLQSPISASSMSVASTRVPMMNAPPTMPTGIPSPHTPNFPVAPNHLPPNPPQTFAPVSNQPNSATPRRSSNAPTRRPRSVAVPRNGHQVRTSAIQSPQIAHPPNSPAPIFRTNGTVTQMVAPAPAPAPMVYPSQLVQSPFTGRNSSQIQVPGPSPIQPQWPVDRRAIPQHPQPQHMQPLPSKTFLLPRPGQTPTNTSRPNPLRDALHQAHLRSPTNRLVARGPEGDQETELFQYLRSFAISPILLGQSQTTFHWQFPLSKANLDRIPRGWCPGTGQRSVRVYTEGCQTYRIRCIRVTLTASGEVSQSTWSTAESVWPSVFYMFINDVEIFARRRVHHGKDIPLDITEHLREGPNTISLHLIRSPAETKDLVYAIGVEVLDITGFSEAKQLAQMLAPSKSREQIRKRLSQTSQDDELSVVSQDLTVDLVDPFTAQCFNRPVRGRLCGHQECFDHDTWITTRASKSGNTMKEDWKCPICGQDARPQSLIVDGFLEEVHMELKRTNRLEGARAIQIKPDGSWILRKETETSDRGALDRTSSKRKHPSGKGGLTRSTKKPKTEQSPSTNIQSIRDTGPPIVITLD